MNSIFHNLSTKRWIFIIHLLQGVNVHGLFLEGAGWEDGKGEDEARDGAVDEALQLDPHEMGKGLFESRDMSCHQRVWDLVEPPPNFIMLEVFQNSRNEIKIKELPWEDFCKPLYALHLHPTQDSSG